MMGLIVTKAKKRYPDDNDLRGCWYAIFLNLGLLALMFFILKKTVSLYLDRSILFALHGCIWLPQIVQDYYNYFGHN